MQYNMKSQFHLLLLTVFLTSGFNLFWIFIGDDENFIEWIIISFKINFNDFKD